MQSRRRIIGVAAVLVIAGAAFFIYRYEQPVVIAPTMSPFAAARDASRPIPVLFAAPPFSFVDQTGQPISDASLRGHLWIADFVFTHCAGQCPMVTARMVELQKAIDDSDVRFVSFSVDPERDDSATLKNYAADHNASETRWVLLRPPDKATIQHVAQRMSAMAPSPEKNDPLIHTDFFILVDTEGRVRALYDSKDPRVTERVKMDVVALVRQKILDEAARSNPAGSKNIE